MKYNLKAEHKFYKLLANFFISSICKMTMDLLKPLTSCNHSCFTDSCASGDIYIYQDDFQFFLYNAWRTFGVDLVSVFLEGLQIYLKRHCRLKLYLTISIASFQCHVMCFNL
jgi:hypothetical protein